MTNPNRYSKEQTQRENAEARQGAVLVVIVLVAMTACLGLAAHFFNSMMCGG